MNWFKITNNIPPIEFVSYSGTYNILKIRYNNLSKNTFKDYEYFYVNPKTVDYIRKLLEKSNYKKVQEILTKISEQSKLYNKKNIKPETREEQEKILKELEERGIFEDFEREKNELV